MLTSKCSGITAYLKKEKSCRLCPKSPLVLGSGIGPLADGGEPDVCAGLQRDSALQGIHCTRSRRTHGVQHTGQTPRYLHAGPSHGYEGYAPDEVALLFMC